MLSKVRRSRDPVERYRLFWTAAGVALCSTLIAIGSGYLVAGRGATLAPAAFQVIVAIEPGGLRTHGAIMTLLGVGNLWGLAQLTRYYTCGTWRLVRWTSIAILFYSLWVVIAFLGAMWIDGHYNPGIWWYLLVAAISGAKVSLPPPFRGNDPPGADCV